MPRPSSCRFVVALVLAAVLLVPALGAAAPGPGSSVPGGLAAPAPGDLIAQLWGFFTRLWSANGFEIDPNGLPGAGSATRSAACDNGLEIDPDGRCVAASAASSAACDNGLELDPNGRCVG